VSPRFVPASVTELQRSGLLAELSGQTLTRLAERMLREEPTAGTVLVREGAADDRFYILLSGVAAVSQSDLGARRLLRPGEVFGEVAAAMGVARTATVTAVTPCVVASCDRQTFDEFLRPLYADDPDG
jgi:ATP-binding cassette subfamily B protein